MDTENLLNALEPLVTNHFTYACCAGVMNLLSDSTGRLFTIHFHPHSVSIYYMQYIKPSTAPDMVKLQGQPNETVEHFADRIYNTIQELD